ncbi:MAG TPA: PAS domain-containing sensor histidine kinase [Phototrophicaceae bacterium]|nr:PAS domain-containing sensor histidine kinase [Phototrophicaceae bacterium]
MAVNRLWQWLTLVHCDDPIRLALNRGFAHIILFFIFITIFLIFALFASGEKAAIVSVVSIPIQTFMWWLNRRGTVYGAGLYVLWVIVAFVAGSPPASYAGADTPIPLLLIFPVITATLFIRPRAGLWALILMMTTLGIQLVLSDVPREHMMRFLVVGTLNLLAITIFLMTGASIFWRVLGASIAANEQFHYAALATQDAIYDWDLRTNVVLRNDTYQRLYASDDPKAAVQAWWEIHVHPDDYERVKTGMQNIFDRHSDYWSDEYRMRRLDGEYATVIDRAYVFYNPAGQPIRMIGAMTDVTERKRAAAEHLELALARERTELLKEFFNTVSHDLKTPLTIINTSLYLLEKTDDPERQKSRMDKIKEQVEHLSIMIQDILAISRLDNFPDLVFQTVEIDGLLAPLQTQFQDVVKEHCLTLTFDLAPNLPPIQGSAPDLQRAFVNLVENALHYTLSGGTVTVRAFEASEQVGIEVKDSGIGIGETDLSHIFEPFYRSTQAQLVNSRGTGLGLAIVKKIVDQHQGKIDVSSVIGQGTTFRVLLPTVPKNAS